ncbi:MAG: hypothetical protein ISS76_08305 [Phycisphaerae bacterium]|nr:hypothetical protein [Phycisphaerae bacterium]
MKKTKKKQTKEKDSPSENLDLSPTGILAIYAENITKVLNKFAYQQDDREVVVLYISYRQLISNLLTKELPEQLPKLPTLMNREPYKGLISLAEFCEGLAKDKKPTQDMIPVADAIKYAKSQNRKIAMSTFTKSLDKGICKPEVRFKQLHNKAGKKHGKTVHFGDFKEYISTLPKIKPDITDKAIDEYIGESKAEYDILTREKDLRHKKSNPKVNGYERLANKISELDA